MFQSGVNQEFRYERELEDGLERFLHGPFEHHPAASCRGDAKVISKTARGGAKSGKWTQPDFTLIAVQYLRLHRRIDLELFSFELKRANDSNVDSVFEAVAHTRYAHYAYLAWHQPIGSSIRSGTHHDVVANCRGNGIGLIIFTDPMVPASYDIVLAPSRKSPHPVDVEEFLAKRLRDDDLAKLREHIHDLESSLP